MKLNGHSLKPDPVFFGQGDYYLGLELEMECGTEDNRDKGLSFLKNPSYCYAKTDGSLRDSGWEIVTHPMSVNLWKSKRKRGSAAASFFSYIEKLRRIGYTSHSNKRCGLHIHVSLSAFGINADSAHKASRKKAHLYWFMRLVNSDLFKRISQRDNEAIEKWTKLIGVRTDSFYSQSDRGDRYLTTNLTKKTVEVRIFRGNMREDRIRKSIESVVAAVEFSKRLSVADYLAFQKKPNKLTNDFLEHVEGKADEYINLYKYLVEIGQIGAKDETPDAAILAEKAKPSFSVMTVENENARLLEVERAARAGAGLSNPL